MCIDYFCIGEIQNKERVSVRIEMGFIMVSSSRNSKVFSHNLPVYVCVVCVCART